MKSVISVDDLSGDDLHFVFTRAAQHLEGHRPQSTARGRLLGLVFLETSLRTRVGFAAAAARLGWSHLEILERRHGPSSKSECWLDTVRTVAGYADVVVARPGHPLAGDPVLESVPCPLINGGDTGRRAEHPSQALIDVFAMEQFAGPLSGLSVAIVGDPRMRSVRSLLSLFVRKPPRMITFVVDERHRDEIRLAEESQPRSRTRAWAELGDVDVVYIAGIPHAELPLDRRHALVATAERVNALPPKCVLLSPMPVIDEMDPEVRRSFRNRMYEQSDLGLYVRMALLECVIREVD